MAFGYLNERTQKVIEMLLKRSSEITIKEVAAELSCSTRTVYNELDRANGWLQMKKLPVIEVRRGKIQLFQNDEKYIIGEALRDNQQVEDYIFTPEERIRMIICLIIISQTPVYVEDLMNATLVSRNTIFTDLQAVVSLLQSYQLGLDYEPKKGYSISGDTIRVRAIFFLFFNMLEPLFEGGKLNFISMDELTPYYEKIKWIEADLKVKYVRNDMIALAAMIPIMESDSQNVVIPDFRIYKIKESEEFKLVTKYFYNLSEQEQVYLSLHFLGGRLSSYSEERVEAETDEYNMEIARNLVAEFERRACVVFEKKDRLIQNLYQHIKASMYRYRFGIQIGNPMADMVKKEYPYIFDVVRASVQYLEQQIGVQISDSEVSYLSLHFGANLQFVGQEEKELRILVVCMNGVATGNMISHELKRILPQAKIVGVVAASKLVNPQNMCDLIVTSVHMQSVVPVIVVNPILNDFDRKNILNHPLIKSRFGFVDIEALFHVVKKYVLKEHYDELHRDLEDFFTRGKKENQPLLNPEIWHLADFLTDDRIVFLDAEGRRAGEPVSVQNDGRSVWERALYTTAEPLITRNSITEQYIRETVDRLHTSGPYMFLTNDLILAHASPDKGVNHLDLSIGIAPMKIPFECGKKARIILYLAVEDQQKHMGVLRDIRKSMAKRKQIDEITALDTAYEVCELLRKRLNEG